MNKGLFLRKNSKFLKKSKENRAISKHAWSNIAAVSENGCNKMGKTMKLEKLLYIPFYQRNNTKNFATINLNEFDTVDEFWFIRVCFHDGIHRPDQRWDPYGIIADIGKNFPLLASLSINFPPYRLLNIYSIDALLVGLIIYK